MPKKTVKPPKPHVLSNEWYNTRNKKIDKFTSDLYDWVRAGDHTAALVIIRNATDALIEQRDQKALRRVVDEAILSERVAGGF